MRGFRIELGEIESVLCMHPGIQKAVVLTHAEPGSVKRIIAYYVSRSGQTISASDLREHVKRKLPDYMVPAAFIRIDDIPLTANGKVDRKALPEPEAERPTLPHSMRTTFARRRDPSADLGGGLTHRARWYPRQFLRTRG